MNSSIWVSAQLLPSIRHFLERIVQDLIEHRNVALFLPPGIEPDEIWDWVKAELYRREITYMPLKVNVLTPVPADPNELAHAALRQRVGENARRSDALRNPECPQVISLSGFECLTTEHRVAWANLVERWLATMRNHGNSIIGGRTLCIIAPAEHLQMLGPLKDVLFTRRYWWGFPSSLELRLLSRELRGDDPERFDWQECLLAGVAAGDLALVKDLVEAEPQTIRDLVDVLKEVGRRRGFCAAQMPTFGSSQCPTPAPPKGVEAEWAAGRLVASFEFGTEPHPAIFALRGETEPLMHRVWRGQSPVVLPLIDRVRLMATRYLVRQHGSRWFESIDFAPLGETERARLGASPLDAELPYLAAVFRRLNGTGPRARSDLVARIRDARNEFAHYVPLDGRVFRDVLDAADACEEWLA